METTLEYGWLARFIKWNYGRLPDNTCSLYAMLVFLMPLFVVNLLIFPVLYPVKMFESKHRIWIRDYPQYLLPVGIHLIIMFIIQIVLYTQGYLANPQFWLVDTVFEGLLMSYFVMWAIYLGLGVIMAAIVGIAISFTWITSKINFNIRMSKTISEGYNSFKNKTCKKIIWQKNEEID